MSQRFAGALWQRVQGWFAQQAEHVTVAFLPDDGAAALPANQGYLRLWLAEGFLAQQRQWGATHFPVLHGGAALTFLGGQASFTSFSRPPEAWQVPGAQLDFPLTPLLPFTGGTVEVEAALYQASVQGPLGTAVDLVGSLASLMGPPLATAAAIADKVSDGLDAVLGATGSQPVLAMHRTLVSPGGGGTVLQPGQLVVLGAPARQLGGEPVIVDGRLHLRTAAGPVLPTGVDYLAVRVECRTERDDWRLPELDELIRAAGQAAIRGQQEIFADRRTEALVRAWGSTDLVPPDRKRVAMLVREELDSLGELGVVARGERGLAAVAAQRLPARDDARLVGLTLADMLN